MPRFGVGSDRPAGFRSIQRERLMQRWESVPPSPEFIRLSSGRGPQWSESVPQSSELVPQRSELVPQSWESLPQSWELVPRRSELLPQSSGRPPQSTEVHPQAAGRCRNWRQPIKHIVPWASNGGGFDEEPPQLRLSAEWNQGLARQGRAPSSGFPAAGGERPRLFWRSPSSRAVGRACA